MELICSIDSMLTYQNLAKSCLMGLKCLSSKRLNTIFLKKQKSCYTVGITFCQINQPVLKSLLFQFAIGILYGLVTDSAL